MYLLKLLQHQGMSGEQISVVTYSIIVSRILYALPAWGAFLSAKLTNKINALFRRLKRFVYNSCSITVSILIDTSGRDLFRELGSSEHSLHHLLPPERKYSNFWNRGHPYELPEYCTNLHKKSFIIQSLHLYIWFLTFVSCLLTVTLHLVDMRLTCLINITYFLWASFDSLRPTVFIPPNLRGLDIKHCTWGSLQLRYTQENWPRPPRGGDSPYPAPSCLAAQYRPPQVWTYFLRLW